MTVDPCATLLLDLVATHESTGLGGYTAVIGSRIGDPRLTAMTLDEIDQYQLYLVNEAHRPSGAVGRYQIIRVTLLGLRHSLGLMGGEQYTPELQDRLGLELLKQRGYDAWRTGRLSDDGFAHRLSCEWASLPDPYNHGRSHYDHDGINHAGGTLDWFLNGLRKARTAVAYDRYLCAKQMQMALQQAGLYRATIDGQWGPLSRAAYDQFNRGE